jgi:phosphoribosyl 1,2-cyclic phosphodiesterase
MIVRCWGARGSIPVFGKEYLRYGGSTTCLELRTAGDDIMVIDAGTGIRQLGNRLLEEKRTNCTLFFTHAHWDHLMGFPFFRPVYRKDFSLTVYGCPLEDGDMKQLLSGLMSPPYFPVPLHGLHADVQWMRDAPTDTPIIVNGVSVRSIPLNHPNRGLGYKFVENGRTFVFLTDNELDGTHAGGRSYEEYVAFCTGADLLIHDAEFTEEEYAATRGWGHSTWTRALQLAMDAGVHRFGLFHHNQDHSDDVIDGIVTRCLAQLRQHGVEMQCFGVREGMEIDLS